MRHGSPAQFNLVGRNFNGTVREFVVPVQHQDTKCNFQKHLDVALRDGLVTGIYSADLHSKGPPYSERAEDLNESGLEPALLLNQSFTKPHQCQDRQHDSRRNPKAKRCRSCGGHHPRQECKFRQTACYKCQKKDTSRKVVEVKRLFYPLL